MTGGCLVCWLVGSLRRVTPCSVYLQVMYRDGHRAVATGWCLVRFRWRVLPRARPAPCRCPWCQVECAAFIHSLIRSFCVFLWVSLSTLNSCSLAEKPRSNSDSHTDYIILGPNVVFVVHALLLLLHFSPVSGLCAISFTYATSCCSPACSSN